MSLMDAFRNFREGLVSLIETGSWSVTEAADEARDPKKLIDRIPIEVKIHGQQALDSVDEVFTTYTELEQKATKLRGQIDHWTKQAKEAADRAKTFPEGSDEYEKFKKLALKSLGQKKAFELRLEPIQRELDDSRDEFEAAQAALTRIGLDKEKALSAVETLKIENASADMALKIGEASKHLAADGTLGAMLNELEEKVDKKKARARSAELIRQGSPQDPEEVDAELSRLTAEHELGDELAALMADAPQAPATPAADSAPAAA